uniref:PLAC domain-containing protein n=1 Tax=Hucho hucho TaxID=62062 RepID=A0A4W5L3K9_9TELE
MEKKEACKSGYEVCDTAVMSQPNTLAKWNSRILDCCIDRRVCLCGTFCSMCLACQMAERYGECFCLPLLPTTMMMMRTSMRERYNIPGSCRKYVQRISRRHYKTTKDFSWGPVCRDPEKDMELWCDGLLCRQRCLPLRWQRNTESVSYSLMFHGHILCCEPAFGSDIT